MGKNLKGKELGPGLSQRKDGRYCARLVVPYGKRISKYFSSLPEAARWLYDAQKESEFRKGSFTAMTVDEWFDRWVEYHLYGRRPQTINQHRSRYKNYYHDAIGDMQMEDVKPIHLQQILKQCAERLSSGTVSGILTTGRMMFEAARSNGVIQSDPAANLYLPTALRTNPLKVRYMNESQQKMFEELAVYSNYYEHFIFLLDTGLRISELRGLTFADVDLYNRTIRVNKNLYYDTACKKWVVNGPKTPAGNRVVPMTQRAYEIAKKISDERLSRYMQDGPLSQETFTYLDYNRGKVTFKGDSLLFVRNDGKAPATSASYNSVLKNIIKDIPGIDRLSLHDLRHTFATRAIKKGVEPKVLQKILGHSSLAVTMDLYVHVDDKDLFDAMNLFGAEPLPAKKRRKLS